MPISKRICPRKPKRLLLEHGYELCQIHISPEFLIFCHGAINFQGEFSHILNCIDVPFVERQKSG